MQGKTSQMGISETYLGDKDIEAPLKPHNGTRGTVFVIDDEPDIRWTIRQLLKIHDWTVETYPSCEAFLKADNADKRGCVLIDARMPGMSGLELLRHLKKSAYRLPAIMITGNGDIDMAVSAMKSGAIDFIEKPVGSQELLSSIDRASEMIRDVSGLTTSREEAIARMATLSPRQRQILDLVVAGHPSKNIAIDLGLSQRTIENHRSTIMQKMGASSIPELIRLSIAAS